MKNLISWIRSKTSSCLLCRDYHPEPWVVCKLCYQLLKPIGHACTICKHPLPESSFSICGYCIKEKPAFDQLLTHYRYDDPLKPLLHEFKYKEGLYLRSFIAQLMLDALPSSTYQSDCIIPVPLHSDRIRQRGFNQAAELGKWLAKRLGIQFNQTVCMKRINTKSQVELNRRARKHNLRGVFQVNPNHYQHVTIVDDLYTTGSTANELAKSLKQQGVKRVDVWCPARTC